MTEKNGGKRARTELATFAAGCFWGVEAGFAEIPGVVRTTVGYTGGTTKDPTYEKVCSGTTGHAEAVVVEFDPTRLTFARLLDKFWEMHDPTTRDRQGPDLGSQYRSAVFTHSPAQQAEALASRDRLAGSGRVRREIVTQIVPAGPFTPAEDYHQKYYAKRGGGSCHIR